MLYCIAVGLLCFFLGLYLSHFGPQYQGLIRRLRGINEVSLEAFNDEVDMADAMLFITLESNLNIVDGTYVGIELVEKKS